MSDFHLDVVHPRPRIVVTGAFKKVRLLSIHHKSGVIGLDQWNQAVNIAMAGQNTRASGSENGRATFQPYGVTK